MITGIFAVVLSAIVALGWALDKRAARRREDANYRLGRIVEREFSALTQHEKDMMFADVMASHHERQGSVSKKDWDWYMVGTLAFAVTCMALSALVWVSL